METGPTMYLGSCCGNSFVILNCQEVDLERRAKVAFASKNIADHNVDSALFIRRSGNSKISLEIFERDGSESESCGNGIILAAYLLGLADGTIKMMNHAAMVIGDSERLAMLMSTELLDVKEIHGRKNTVFVKCGEPHVVCLVDDLGNVDLPKVGEALQRGQPNGVNVSVIQRMSDCRYLIRTYERGVFAETKSCGTGSLSAYVAISYFDHKKDAKAVEFKSAGGSHWVSNDKDMLRLETLKSFCKIHKLQQPVWDNYTRELA